jgi:hypothetical protein
MPIQGGDLSLPLGGKGLGCDCDMRAVLKVEVVDDDDDFLRAVGSRYMDRGLVWLHGNGLESNGSDRHGRAIPIGA